MAAQPRKHLRIFISSPGDVAEERRIAREVIESVLPQRPALRGVITTEVVAWDHPHGDIPMPAGMSPQEAIDAGLPQPSDCDLTIVILWGRLGSPLSEAYVKPDGTRYTGTEWEFENSYRRNPNGTFIYQRDAPPDFQSGEAAELRKAADQREVLDAFIRRFRDSDGSYTGSVNRYSTPDDFKNKITRHLEEIVLRSLRSAAGFDGRGVPITEAGRFGLTNHLPAYRVGADQFVESYLGTSGRKVPFGGRGQELKKLNDWLNDETAPRRLLLTAPPARGKSALVVRWLDQLDKSWHPILLPISIRFEINRELDFYQALAGSLAAAFGEDLPRSSTDPVEFYKGLAIDWLRRTDELSRRLLLVIDGLDEAAGWQIDRRLLPHDPPSSLRILVSARILVGDAGADGWMSRLAWSDCGPRPSTVEPRGLDDRGIADALAAMGEPVAQMARNRELASELLRLTLGDPLLVRLYVEDLVRSSEGACGLATADFARLEPGFGNYFKRWLDDQYRHWRESGAFVDQAVIDTILAILGCAFGPLMHSDLVHLCRELSDVRLGPSSRSLEPLQRFIIGDGRSQGYVLSHPKLATYLQSEHFADTNFVQRARETFLIWGRSVVANINSGEILPHDLPAYIRDYFAAHLIDADAPLTHFMQMVEDGWRTARECADDGPHGFASDVRRALSRCGGRVADAHRLRCAIVLSSLLSVGQNIPAEVLGAAVRHKRMSLAQALYQAEQKDAAAKAHALWQIGRHQSERRRSDILELALGAIERVEKSTEQETLLSSMMPELEGAQHQRAFEICRNIRAPRSRANALLAVSRILDGDQAKEAVSQALASARAVQNDHGRAFTLAAILPHVSDQLYHQLIIEIESIAQSKKDDDGDISIYSAILRNAAAPEKIHYRQIIIDRLNSLPKSDYEYVLNASWAAETSRDEYLIDTALAKMQECPAVHIFPTLWDFLRKVAKELTDRQLNLVHDILGRARQCLETPVSWHLYIDSLCFLLPRVSKGHLFELSRYMFGVRFDDHDRVDIIRAFGPHCSASDIDRLLDATALLQDASQRGWAVAPAAASMGSEQTARALELCKEIGDRSYVVLADVACNKELGAEEFERALNDALGHARTISRPYSRAQFLAALAEQARDPLRATLVADAKAAYRAGNTKAEHLEAKLIVLEAPALSGDLLEQTFEAVSSYSAPAHRAEALRALAPRLSGEQVCSTVDMIFKLGKTYNAPKASIVAAIASRLSDAQRTKLVQQALTWANDADEHQRATALTNLAQAFPEQIAIRRQALRLARSLDNVAAKANALTYLFPILPPDEAEDALLTFMDLAPALKRSDLMRTIINFINYMSRTSGAATIIELRRAIDDCAKWYP